MSFSKKKIRRLTGVGLSVFSAICASQVSYAKVNVEFYASIGTLHFSGNGVIEDYNWRKLYAQQPRIKRIVIEDGIKGIGKNAFCCLGMEEITIPSSVTSIGDSAFWNCKSLKKITIPNSVSIIGNYAFCSCNMLETVKFENMSKCNKNSCWYVLLRKGSFGGCKKLRILDFGDDTNMSRIAKVEKYAFSDCDPNFWTYDGKTVRSNLYNTVLNHHYNYFIPHGILVDKAKYWYR